MWQAGDDGPAVGPQVIFGFDTTGRCTMSTGPGLAGLGLRPDELVGKNLYTVYGGDAGAVAALDRVLDGEAFSAEREFDGRRLCTYCEPVRDADGKVTGAIGVSTDVTEQQRIEWGVHAERERASLLADVSAALASRVLDVQSLLGVAVRAATEGVAEVGGVWLRAAQRNRVELRALWTGDEDDLAVLEELAGTAPGDLPSFEVEADALTKPELLDLRALSQLAGPDADMLLRGVQRFGLTWLLRVPLRARGVFLGLVDVARGPNRDSFEDDDISLVSDIAQRCALALDNALLLSSRRDAREELLKFQALADASDDFIAIADGSGALTYVNPRLRGSGVQIRQGDVWFGVATAAGEAVAADIRRALASAGRWSGDVTASIGGREVVTHGEVFHLAHPDTGAALGTAWIGQDVTEVRTTERALRSANTDMKQFKALVEASPDFIAIAGVDGKVMYVIPRGREMVGLDPQVDVTSTTMQDYLTPEGLRVSVEIEQPAVIAHGHWEGESSLRNRRGPAIPVAIASFLIRDAETGEPFAVATVQRDISERLRAEKALRELADQREALLTSLVDAQDSERTQIAADVHDDPVQVLAAVEVRLGALVRRLRERAPELLDLVEPVQASVQAATDRLRALLFDLEPPDLHHGLGPALRRAAAEIFSHTDTRWRVDGTEEPDAPEATRAVAYRIAKEAMTNVQKHANAKTVTVTVGAEGGGITLRVEDDGVGLGEQPVASLPGHRGLVTMQDRAAVAGGHCEIRNRPGRGTVVTAWLPSWVPA